MRSGTLLRESAVRVELVKESEGEERQKSKRVNVRMNLFSKIPTSVLPIEPRLTRVLRLMCWREK